MGLRVACRLEASSADGRNGGLALAAAAAGSLSTGVTDVSESESESEHVSKLESSDSEPF